MTDQTTITAVLTALRALEVDPIIDPEHGPDQLTDAHLPDLLGLLAGAVDTYSAVATPDPSAESRAAWAHGYRAIAGMTDTAHAAETLLSSIAVRLRLDVGIIAATSHEVGYARLAAPLVAAAATVTMLAASTATPDPTAVIDPAIIHGAHREVRRQIRATRAALDALDRKLKAGGYE